MPSAPRAALDGRRGALITSNCKGRDLKAAGPGEEAQTLGSLASAGPVLAEVRFREVSKYLSSPREGRRWKCSAAAWDA